MRVDAEAIPRVLNGTIDLVYRAADGWRLIDYKTDADASANLHERYGDQIEQYRAAWQQTTGEQDDAQRSFERERPRRP